MTLRHRLRLAGNSFIQLLSPDMRRMLLKSFSDQPELAESVGFHVVPQNFYSPVPTFSEVDRAALLAARSLPGIDLRESEALRLLATLVERYGKEVAEIPRHRSPDCILWLENGTYADFDAATLYAMLRHIKPRRYVEVGCGYSSKASTLALTRNRAEGSPCEADYIEPYPSEEFLKLELLGEYHRVPVQKVPSAVFEKLEDGDVLFIDTSHVLRTQSDVEHELLRILPLLAPGVWVHIHDIFTPYDYPEEWVFGIPRAGNNEQYALECLLSGGVRFQVELPVHFLWRKHRPALDLLCPGTKDRPAAFWMRRRA